MEVEKFVDLVDLHERLGDERFLDAIQELPVEQRVDWCNKAGVEYSNSEDAGRHLIENIRGQHPKSKARKKKKKPAESPRIVHVTTEDPDFQVNETWQSLYRAMEEQEWQSLIDDIRATRTIRDPITVRRVEGGFEILDGHHRYKAWKALLEEGLVLDLPFVVESFPDDAAIRTFLSSKNEVRRHLSLFQKLQQAKELESNIREEIKQGAAKKRAETKAGKKKKEEKHLATSKAMADAVGISQAQVEKMGRLERLMEKYPGRFDEIYQKVTEDEITPSNAVRMINERLKEEEIKAKGLQRPAGPGEELIHATIKVVYRVLEDEYGDEPLPDEARTILETLSEQVSVIRKREGKKSHIQSQIQKYEALKQWAV